MSEQDSAAWGRAAASFDREPDHGLADPRTRAAWRQLLAGTLPDTPSDIADLGCGTGTLTVLLAEAGHRVLGVDFSAEMLALAREKAERAEVKVELTLADVAQPPFRPGSFDVVQSRHVLRAMPDPSRAIRQWSQLLRPGGQLVLVEGQWSTGAGLSAAEARELLAELGWIVEIKLLTAPILWGGPISDERYLATSRPAESPRSASSHVTPPPD